MPTALSFLNKTGFKPAESTAHEVIRVILLIAIVVLVIWHICQSVSDDNMEIDNIADVVQPGTILYNAALELDGEARCRFIANLKHDLTDEQQTSMQKYKKAIGVSLLAGVLSEYIINGNSAKPLGVISKTIIYSAINTMVT